MRPNSNVEINYLNKLKINSDEYLFHAGTKLENQKIFAIGGRVLNFVSISDNFSEARIRAINNISNLDWKEGFYRKDIGYKVID